MRDLLETRDFRAQNARGALTTYTLCDNLVADWVAPGRSQIGSAR